ncbi:MAG: LLM class flavin-dependent oxidoreductase [Actinomycetia bacterium]|nr:LLM class flavin-dependent oxidoreductase [Actinomycetes bacterium]
MTDATTNEPLIPALEFGIAARLLRNTKEEAQRAETLGYDYLLTGEHIMFHGGTTNAMISLAAAAGATERIKLMSGIVLAPLYPAALLAKQASVLDAVSEGRFTLGIGVGGEFPKEFEAVGVPVTERGARTDEALEVLDKLLTERDVVFDGRFTTLDGVTISPPPVQKPRMPFWVAGRKEVAMRRAARFAEGWLPYMYTPEMLADSVVKIEEYTAEANRPPSSVRTGLYIFSCVHEDRETAVELANAQLSRQYNQDFSKLVEKYTIVGNPDDCAARISEYVEAGATAFMFNHGCPPDYTETNTTLLAESVIPLC